MVVGVRGLSAQQPARRHRHPVAVFWQQQPDWFRYLVGAAFVMGLGMANHQTISLLGPAILYLLWRQRKVLLRRPGGVAVCSAALCAGLLPYLYVPLAA